MDKAKARFGGSGRIIVDNCPFCHKTHYHNPPVGEGQRMADCFMGEYILDFDSESDCNVFLDSEHGGFILFHDALTTDLSGWGDDDLMEETDYLEEDDE